MVNRKKVFLSMLVTACLWGLGNSAEAQVYNLNPITVN